MSRSNWDKAFFVDVGTSIVAIRCQSNRDVIDRIDYVRLGKVYIEMANKMCDRMNAEVDLVVAAKDAEIERCRDELRATRERRDVCETKMRKALERVNRAESKCDTLRALVGELTNALLSVVNCEGALTGGCEEDIAWTCPVSKQCGIILRARKMMGDGTL